MNDMTTHNLTSFESNLFEINISFESNMKLGGNTPTTQGTSSSQDHSLFQDS